MQIIDKKLTDLKPYANNPRHNAKAVPAVKESILKFGFKVPLVIDKNNVIVCGHTRFYASKEIGLETVPCIVADDLTQEQINAFRLVDNRTAEFADWNFDKLAEELSDLQDFDFEPFGFDDLMAGLELDYNLNQKDEELIEDDYDAEPPAEPKTKPNDLYKLGNHYLLCGDATNEDDIRKLVNNNALDITITSPPYGAARATKIRDRYIKGKISKKSFYKDYDDNRNNWYDLINKSFLLSKNITKSQFINIQMLADNKKDLIKFVNKNVDNLVDIIIWNKHTCPPQMQKNILNNFFEFVFCFDNDNNSRTIRYGDFHGNISNYIETSREKNKYADVHRAVFPVEFPCKILEINKKAKTVFDSFGGTGTTLIACEQLNRNCYMMELDPSYCDVIVDRWEKFTCKKAEKIE